MAGGFGQAVYEVHDANPFARQGVTIDLGVSCDSNTSADLPAEGSSQVSVGFAPISTVTTASAGAPEPRFIDSSGDPDPFLDIVRCTTTLLFSFVTNQSGFDTGLAISNTSEDWLGTDGQSGACTIHYHGSTLGGGAAPPEQTSTVIGAGAQLIMTLSGGNPAQGLSGAPEFQGYIIAVCEFQYAHGFAFITDGYGEIPALDQGYLALIIPEPLLDRVAGVPGLHNLGEALKQLQGSNIKASGAPSTRVLTATSNTSRRGVGESVLASCYSCGSWRGPQIQIRRIGRVSRGETPDGPVSLEPCETIWFRLGCLNEEVEL